MSAENKANEELAKLGQKALETADKAGGWTDKVFGEGFRQLGAAFADSMAGYRVRNRLRVLEKTQKAIDESGMAGNTRSLDPRISLPLLEAIGDESDDALQDVWAAYIRNAVDPKLPIPNRLLIDTIRRLEPGDWPILQLTFNQLTGTLSSQDFGIEQDVLHDTMDRLHALGLFDYDDDTVVYLVAEKASEKRLSVKIDRSEYLATRLLRRLASATVAWRQQGTNGATPL